MEFVIISIAVIAALLIHMSVAIFVTKREFKKIRRR